MVVTKKKFAETFSFVVTRAPARIPLTLSAKQRRTKVVSDNGISTMACLSIRKVLRENKQMLV